MELIGQHLLFRCKKGYYDNSMSAGIKTAAVSNSIAELPYDIQKEINGKIAKYAVLPDNVYMGGRKINRGILRISETGNMKLISRIFRVKDRCDNRGDVCFTHTYVVTGSDLKTLMEFPGSLSHLECFDNYENIDERCGGIANGNPVTICDSLKNVLVSSKLDADILEELQIDKQNFELIISALCSKLENKGSLALILSGIDKNTWEEEGGSLLGEQLMLFILELLPSCIRKKFSGVSYWNESLNFYGLENVKFLILSEEPENKPEGNTIINIRKEHEPFKVRKSVFCSYLWDIRNNMEQLALFHEHIRTVFGKNVDCVAKLPSVMDCVTQMYLYPQADCDNIQEILETMFKLFGNSMRLFPEIHKYFQKGIQHIGDTNQQLSLYIQKILVRLLKKNILISSSMIYKCFLNSLYCGSASKDVIECIKNGLLKGTETDLIHFFQQVLLQAEKNSSESLSEQFMELIIGYYIDPSANEQLFYRITQILLNDIKHYYKQKDHHICLKIYALIFRSEKLFNLYDTEYLSQYYGEIYQWIYNIIQCDPSLSDDAAKILAEHFKLITKTEFSEPLSDNFEYKLFEKYPDIFQFNGFFRLFIIISPYLSQKGRILWYQSYHKLLAFDSQKYQDCDHFLEIYEPKIQSIGLLCTENARVQYFHRANWKNIEKIINTITEIHTDKFDKICEIIQLLTQNINNFEEILNDIEKTKYIYYYYFFAYSLKDQMITKQIEFHIIKDPNYLDNIIAIAEKENNTDMLKEVYFKIWSRKYSNYIAGNYLSIDEDTIDNIREAEDKLRNKLYCIDIMSQFGQLFNNMMQSDPNGSESSIISNEVARYICWGIQEYHWDYYGKWNQNRVRQLRIRVALESELSANIMHDLILYSNGTDSYVYKLRKYIREMIKNFNVNKVDEKIAFLGFLLLRCDMKKGGGQCGKYLDIVTNETSGEGKNSWKASGYIMYGLKYLIISKEIDKQFDIRNEIMDSFISILQTKIRIDGKQNLLNYQDMYHNTIKPKLPQQFSKRLSDTSQKTKDEELISMFHVVKPNNSQGVTGIKKAIENIFRKKSSE